MDKPYIIGLLVVDELLRPVISGCWYHRSVRGRRAPHHRGILHYQPSGRRRVLCHIRHFRDESTTDHHAHHHARTDHHARVDHHHTYHGKIVQGITWERSWESGYWLSTVVWDGQKINRRSREHSESYCVLTVMSMVGLTSPVWTLDRFQMVTGEFWQSILHTKLGKLMCVTLVFDIPWLPYIWRRDKESLLFTGKQHDPLEKVLWTIPWKTHWRHQSIRCCRLVMTKEFSPMMMTVMVNHDILHQYWVRYWYL